MKSDEPVLIEEVVESRCCLSEREVPALHAGALALNRMRSDAMHTTPQMYFDYFVRENYDDFVRSRTDVRKAFNAAVSAFHMCDVFSAYWGRRDHQRVPHWPDRSKFLKYLGGCEPQFKVIQSVATIYKHMYVAKPFIDGGSPQSIRGVVARNGVVVESGWASADGDGVSLRRCDGTNASLNVALEQVVKRMWPRLLAERKALPEEE